MDYIPWHIRVKHGKTTKKHGFRQKKHNKHEDMGLSENSVANDPMVNDHYPY
jgi:hypothetical protein